MGSSPVASYMSSMLRIMSFTSSSFTRVCNGFHARNVSHSERVE